MNDTNRTCAERVKIPTRRRTSGLLGVSTQDYAKIGQVSAHPQSATWYQQCHKIVNRILEIEVSHWETWSSLRRIWGRPVAMPSLISSAFSWASAHLVPWISLLRILWSLSFGLLFLCLLLPLPSLFMLHFSCVPFLPSATGALWPLSPHVVSIVFQDGNSSAIRIRCNSNLLPVLWGLSLFWF